MGQALILPFLLTDTDRQLHNPFQPPPHTQVNVLAFFLSPITNPFPRGGGGGLLTVLFVCCGFSWFLFLSVLSLAGQGKVI